MQAKLETTTHLFWECKKTRGLWYQYYPNSDIILADDRKEWTAPDFCELIWKGPTVDKLEEEKLKKSLIICWQIWAYRNDILHNNKQYHPNHLIQSINRYLTEFTQEDEMYQGGQQQARPATPADRSGTSSAGATHDRRRATRKPSAGGCLYQ